MFCQTGNKTRILQSIVLRRRREEEEKEGVVL